MKKLSNKLIEKISQEKIIPKSKWEFIIRKYSLWGLFIFNSILGAYSISLIIYILNEETKLSVNSLREMFVLSFPYFWLILTGLLISLGYYYYNKTDVGYRTTISKYFLINLSLSLTLALLLSLSGITERFNNIFSSSIPYYAQITDPRVYNWMRPDIGRVIGTIEDIDYEYKTITLEDYSNNKWLIGYESAFVNTEISIGGVIRVEGQLIENNSIEAFRILPLWKHTQGRGQNFHNNCARNFPGNCINR
jgi:hypothetical protein